MIKEVYFVKTMEHEVYCAWDNTYHITFNTYKIGIDGDNNPVVIGYHYDPDLWTPENVHALKAEAKHSENDDFTAFLEVAENEREWIENRIEDERMEARLALLGARFRKLHGL